MPTYNYGRYVSAAIESVLQQTHEDFELFVIDDGSTDNTADIVSGITDPRLQFARVPNGGVSRARNHALQRARGDAVAFLDADDVWLPHKLATQLRVLHENPDVGFVATNFVRFRNDGTQLSDQFHYMTRTAKIALRDSSARGYGVLPGNALVALCGQREMPWYPSANMVRRTVAHDLEFPAGVRLGEDLHYFNRVWMRTRAALIHTVGLRLRVHDSNSSHSAGEKTHQQRTIDQFTGLLALELTREQERAVRRRIAMEWASVGYSERQKKRFTNAAKAYSQACATGGASWRMHIARALAAGRAIFDRAQ